MKSISKIKFVKNHCKKNIILPIYEKSNIEIIIINKENLNHNFKISKEKVQKHNKSLETQLQSKHENTAEHNKTKQIF